MSMISRYVRQDDVFFAKLTVYEHLMFHAMLRMDKNISYETKLERVERVITQFSLPKDGLIGNPGTKKPIHKI